MKALLLAALVGALAAFPPGAHAAPVPTTISFSARLVDDASGEEVTGSHRATFSLYDVEAAGTALWTETRDVEVEEGLLFVDLGEMTALDGSVLDGRKLFLEVSFDGAIMEPRVRLGSVPYAVRATDAENAATIGGLAADAFQKRVTGNCGSGNFIIAVNDDGTVACAPDLSGSGDITDVVPGSGLQGGGAAGSVTLSLINCGQNEVLKFQGSVWACAQDTDTNSGGDITAVSIGAAGGIVGGGTSGDVALSLLTNCGAGQTLKFNGTWGCANDIDTNSGGTITGVSVSGNSGLTGGGASGNVSLSLLTNCANGQVLKFNTSTAAWGCANDIDTDTNAGGDITDVIAGNGLTGGGSTGLVQVDIGQGTGIIVGANAVSLDTTFTDNRYDGRYVDVAGDVMSGTLDMNGQRVINRGCQAGYVKHGPICLEDIDVASLTFSACANRCRQANAHIPSSGELRAVMQSGITIGNGGLAGDWADDMDSTTNVFVINSGTDPNNWTTLAQTATTAFCRCATSVE